MVFNALSLHYVALVLAVTVICRSYCHDGHYKTAVKFTSINIRFFAKILKFAVGKCYALITNYFPFT